MIKVPTARRLSPILLAVILLVAANAQAKGFFMVGQPFQYVDFTYQLNSSYTGSDKSSSSSSTQRLTPSYSLSLPYAILDPTFLVGTVNGSLNFNQFFNSGSGAVSSSSNKLGYTYALDGTLLKESKMPVQFFATSTETTTQQDFAPPSNVMITSYGSNAYSRNKVVPTFLMYRHDWTKTTTGPDFFESDQDQASLTSSYNFRNFVNLALNTSYLRNQNNSNQWGANTTTNQYSLNLTNSLLLYNLHNRLGTLTTTLFYLNFKGSYPSDNLQFSVNYDGSLGRALLLGTSYTYGKSNSSNQSQQSNSGQIYLEHRLFDSLRTRLTGTVSYFDYETRGSLDVTNLGGISTYTKKLPHDAVLQVEVGDNYLVRDSKLTDARQTQFNELIAITPTNFLYSLKNTSVVAIIEVWDKNHTRRYSPNIDYELQTTGITGYIFIVPSGNIHSGDTLAVTYEYLVDPSVKYSTNTIYTNGSYTLFGGRYIFQAQYSESQSSLLEGRPGNFTPTDSRYLRFSARANLQNAIFGIQYVSTDNYNTSQQTAEAYMTYNGTIGRNNVGLQLSDTYSHSSVTAYPVSLSSGDSSTNTLVLTASLQRQLFLTGNLQMNASYLMIRGGPTPGQDNVMLRLNYDLPLGKFRLRLDAYSYLRMYNTTRNIITNVTLSLRRYF